MGWQVIYHSPCVVLLLQYTPNIYRQHSVDFSAQYRVSCQGSSWIFCLTKVLSPPRRRALWAERIIGPVYTRRVQKRRQVRQPACRWLHVPVSARGVRETLLWDDHPQLPRTVLHHLQRPEAEVPLHHLLHVSTHLPSFLPSFLALCLLSHKVPPNSSK